MFGSRLHCNLAVSSFVSADSHGFDVNYGSYGLAVCLVNAVSGIKIAKQRLSGNLVLGWHTAKTDVLTAVLSAGYGYVDTNFSHEISLDEIFTSNPLAIGMASSCS